MVTQLLKKTLFSRIISFVVAFSFILTSVPVSYAYMDKLKPRAAEDDPRGEEIIDALKKKAVEGEWKTSIPMLDAYKDKLKGRRVYLRVDLNVLNDEGEFESLTRFDDVLEACNIIIKAGGTPIVATHISRPGGEVVPKFSVVKVAERFVEMARERDYNLPVKTLSGSVTEAGLKPGLKNEIVDGEVNFLENLRFSKKEGDRDKAFAQELAGLVDNYLGVFGGFGSAAVNGASTMDVFEYTDNIAVDPSVETELNQITRIRNNIYMLIFGGGPKINDKVPLLKGILGNFKKGGVLVLGSAPSVVFWKAAWKAAGKTEKNINSAQPEPVGEDTVIAADTVINTAQELGINLLKAVDFKVADKDVSKMNKIPEGVKTYELTVEQLCEPFFTEPGTNNQIPTNSLYIYDLGEKSISNIIAAVGNMPKGSTSFWNGNTGVDFLENSSLQIAKALDQAKTEKDVDSMMAGGTTSELASRINPLLKNKIITSKGGGAALTAMQDGSTPVTDNMELIQRNIETAQALNKVLNVEVTKIRRTLSLNKTAYTAKGGGAFSDYTTTVARYPGEQSLALIVAQDCFKMAGMNNALKELEKLGSVLKIALYGEKADELKIWVGNKDIVTAKTLDDLLAELTKLGIAPANTFLLSAKAEEIDATKLEQKKIRYVVAPDIATLAVAKAVKELVDNNNAETALKVFLSKIIDAQVIEKVSDNTKESIVKKIEGLTYAFPEEVKMTEKVAKDTEEATLVTSEVLDI